MGQQLVTIAVVPGERFSLTKRSLEAILATSDEAELIYVDGGSPPLVRQYLEQRAARSGFRLISTERYVAPNVARNLAAAEARTRYVAFVDNDVLVSPGWLAPLVDCAEATGAWVVGGVCREHEPPDARILSAGATAEIVIHHGRRVLRHDDPHRGRPLASISPAAARREVQMVGLQATLVRREALDRLGPLDERLHSAADDIDLCLSVRGHGGDVYLEPASVVTHLPPPPFEPYDLEHFQWRYSDAANAATVERFRQKWDLAEDDRHLRALAERLADHRRLTLEPYRRVLRLFGRTPARWVERVLIAPFEQAVNRRRFPGTRHDGREPVRKAA